MKLKLSVGQWDYSCWMMMMTIGGKNVSNVARRVAYPHARTYAKLGNAEMEVPGTRTWGNMDVRTGMNDER